LLTNTLQQKLHLIGKHIPVSKNKAFVEVGRVGDEEGQVPPVMRLAVAFGAIAALTSGQYIGPNMLAPFRDRAHMVGGELIIFKAQAAVGAKPAVTANQLAAR
jgi:hypothetical protein